MEEDIKEVPKEKIVEQPSVETSQESLEAPESASAPSQQDLQRAKQLVEQMQIDDDAKAQTAAAAQNLAGAAEQEKLEKLLALAKQKGVIFAVKTAQKMNDPFVLDLLHDKLVEGGHYKEFLK